VEHEPLPDVTHDGRRWSNADDDRVDLVSYDPRWPSLFEAEAGRIRAALSGMLDFALEHFGSTAIPGLPAKPIIDIMVIADAPSSWAGLVEPIQNIGYVFWADNPRRDRMFFVKGMPPFGERRTHHVHVRTPADARASILFRDYLRRHPEDRVRYASLKEELAARYPTDRDAYTEGKAQFVDEVVRRASGG
jgi:GrpB-like predicted nucleotidyltransferase (UPF0157 family)